MRALTGRVRIPEFRGRVDVSHAVIPAPLEDFAGVDIPREIDQQIALADVLREQRAHVFLGHAIAHEADAFRSPRLQLRGPIFEIHYRDVFRRHFHVLEKNRQGAFGHGAVTDEEDFIGEFDHDGVSRSGGASNGSGPLVPKISRRLRATFCAGTLGGPRAN